MENNDTNTDYHKFVRVRDQKWEIVEIKIGINLFLLEICIHYFLYREFSNPSYINVLKNDSASPPPPPRTPPRSPKREGGANYALMQQPISRKGSIRIPPENITKPLVSWCFHEELEMKYWREMGRHDSSYFDYFVCHVFPK